MLDLWLNEVKIRLKVNKKLNFTLLILFLYRLGNTIPLLGIDYELLKINLFKEQINGALIQNMNLYSGGELNVPSPFSLGLIPFINSSILFDFLITLIPFLENLQSERGEDGKKKIKLYKKLLALTFSIFQSFFLMSNIKDFLFKSDFFHISATSFQLVAGSMILIWYADLLNTKGLGNGISFIILTNILSIFVEKNLFFTKISSLFFFRLMLLFLLIGFICISQNIRMNIDLISARQLLFLEKSEKSSSKKKQNKNNIFQLKENGLSIKLNQAGIFPVIIASNFFPFFTFIYKKISDKVHPLLHFLYYAILILINYLYTFLFWDPRKIAEQLRKASVSLISITPGKETLSHLENIVNASSISGGLILCSLLVFYELINFFFKDPFFQHINMTSLIITVGVSYEIQKMLILQYKNSFQ